MLEGKFSNRFQAPERELSGKFVRSNRWPTRRTMTEMRRSRVTVYFLCGSMKIQSNWSRRDQRFVSIFVQALMKKVGWVCVRPFKSITGKTLELWSKEAFGHHAVQNVISVASDKFTSLYSRKSDPSSTCKVLSKDLRSFLQRNNAICSKNNSMIKNAC